MKTIAIVGATGLVGNKLADVFSASDFNAKFLAFADKSAGTTITIQNRKVRVLPVTQLLQHRPDAAIFTPTKKRR